MALERLVIEYRGEEIAVRCLYRSSLDGPNPDTVRRRRQVEDLVREGLRQALISMERDAALVGCSGFTQREDVLLVDAKQEGDAA
jgi:hypothetical protein